jgi:aldose 1-epimerase
VGDLIRLRAGDRLATVDATRGGRLASLIVAGRELLVPAPDADDRGVDWGCFLMAPWPGRLADGRVPWQGGTVQLRRTREPHALHGVVYDRTWSVDRAEEDQVVLSCGFDPVEWPFGGRVRQRIRLAADHLELHAVITAGPRAMPAALGWHPWFRRTDGEPRLRVDADEVLETRDMIPTGRRRDVAGRTDLRTGPRLGDRRLDHAYVDVRSPVVATWPDLELRFEFRPPVGVLVVYTPPGAVCIEPQTAWPNALGALTPESGVRALEPGETLQAVVRLRWRVTPASGWSPGEA